jgi:perosamine synthetase
MRRPPLSIPLSLGGFLQAVWSAIYATIHKPDVQPISSDRVSCASVRTGLDLILRYLKLPAGSEVILSGITIPHMVDIIEHHRLKCVPIDIEPATLGPDAKDLEAHISSKTRMILITHLFGHRLAIQDYADIAERNHLILIEDCAQALAGRIDAHPRTDFSLFSFGGIKDQTAPGGAIIDCRATESALELRQLESLLPWRGEVWFLKRIFRYLALKLIATPPFYGMICSLIGHVTRQDGEARLYELSRGFKRENLLEQIRFRGSPGSRRFLLKRVQSLNQDDWRKNMTKITTAVRASGLRVAGPLNPDRSWWIIPALTSNRDRLFDALQAEGIAASLIPGSLAVVSGQDKLSLRQCHQIMRQLIFVSKDSLNLRLLSRGSIAVSEDDA